MNSVLAGQQLTLAKRVTVSKRSSLVVESSGVKKKAPSGTNSVEVSFVGWTGSIA